MLSVVNMLLGASPCSPTGIVDGRDPTDSCGALSNVVQNGELSIRFLGSLC